MDRRSFLKTGLIATAAFTSLGRAVRRAAAAPAQPGPGPYGALLEPDAYGIRLPAGFRTRIIAKAGTPVAPSSYVWHDEPDGGATFATPAGGWIYVSNSEVGNGLGGVGAVEFDPLGTIVDARRILSGTSRNCAGGTTPWGTWLSCEETDTGRVWECDPTGASPPVVRPALGRFMHEAASVDPRTNRIYLTEDKSDGRFYRFTMAPSLDAGVLEAMVVTNGATTWVPVPNPTDVSTPVRYQVPGATAFRGGEGSWFDPATRTVYFATKIDNRIWAHHVDSETIEIVYDLAAAPGAALSGVDNVLVSPSGDLYVAEDGGDMQIVIISAEREVAPFLQVVDQPGSEITGPAFDPSGMRLYFSSQRGGPRKRGITYEVSGPFRPVSPAALLGRLP